MKVTRETTYHIELNELGRNYLLALVNDHVRANENGDLANFARSLQAALS